MIVGQDTCWTRSRGYAKLLLVLYDLRSAFCGAASAASVPPLARPLARRPFADVVHSLARPPPTRRRSVGCSLPISLFLRAARSPARSLLALPIADLLPRLLASERQKTVAIGARERGTIPACTGPFMDKPLRVAKNTNTVHHFFATPWNSDLLPSHSDQAAPKVEKPKRSFCMDSEKSLRVKRNYGVRISLSLSLSFIVSALARERFNSLLQVILSLP